MAEDLWQKHEKDAVSVCMWKDENPKCVFYYQEHGLLDLNEMRQDDTPFILGIQTDWQFQMMLKHGTGSALSMDSTFSTTETEVGCFDITEPSCNYLFQ
jgi:hypothetical protein